MKRYWNLIAKTVCVFSLTSSSLSFLPPHPAQKGWSKMRLSDWSHTPTLGLFWERDFLLPLFTLWLWQNGYCKMQLQCGDLPLFDLFPPPPVLLSCLASRVKASEAWCAHIFHHLLWFHTWPLSIQPLSRCHMAERVGDLVSKFGSAQVLQRKVGLSLSLQFLLRIFWKGIKCLSNLAIKNMFVKMYITWMMHFGGPAKLFSIGISLFNFCLGIFRVPAHHSLNVFFRLVVNFQMLWSVASGFSWSLLTSILIWFVFSPQNKIAPN